MKKTTTILTACSVAICASSAMADTAATIFGYASGTAVQYDNASGAFPVVTTILSVPGATVNGKTYSATSGSFLVADATGSLQIFGTPAATYTPYVGDNIIVNGTYSPYHQLPEIGSVTSVVLAGSGSPSPIVQPQVVTVSQTDVPTLPQSIAGQLLQIDNATITGQTTGQTFGIANLTLTVTDSTGSQTLYYWPTSYSSANANLYGQTIPTGPVDIIGIASVFPTGSVDEFLPINIVPAPEPSSIALAAIGGVAVLMGLRRRK